MKNLFWVINQERPDTNFNKTKIFTTTPKQYKCGQITETKHVIITKHCALEIFNDHYVSKVKKPVFFPIKLYNKSIKIISKPKHK